MIDKTWGFRDYFLSDNLKKKRTKLLGVRRDLLTRPPPIARMVIARCSMSIAVHSLPQAAKCSRKTFVEP